MDSFRGGEAAVENVILPQAATGQLHASIDFACAHGFTGNLSQDGETFNIAIASDSCTAPN